MTADSILQEHRADDLAEKINRIWNDDALCKRLGAAARKKVQEQYTDEVHFNQLIQAYENAGRNG